MLKLSKTWSEDAQDAYERKSQRAAEYVLERVMRRLYWTPDTRDDLALQMRIFANERHAELTSTRKKSDG